MLKIKDNVDLKQLEAFGFKLSHSNIYYFKEFEAECCDEKMPHEIMVYVKNRNIALEIMNNDYTYHTFDDELGGIENTLFDLIQAGLVEKVEK